MVGETMGKVIFQKISQEVPPSIFAASYMEMGMDWRAVINSSVWMPDFHSREKILSTNPVTKPTRSSAPCTPVRNTPSISLLNKWEELLPDMTLAEKASPLRILRIIPLAMMMGRKKMPRITVRPKNFRLSSKARKRLSSTMMGT